jgi:hypothetical protein
VSCTVSRNGDLIHKVYLQVDIPDVAVVDSSGTDGTFKWVDNLGHVLIDEVSIEIGGQTIDKHYGEWLTIWNELTQTSEKFEGYNAMIGNVADLTGTTAHGSTKPGATLYIPLQFWFCRNPGLALPLIALQYHEVKFNITFRAASDCYVVANGATASPSLNNASLFVDYIYLDTDERRQFSQVQHEYLIEQLQFTGAESFSNSSVKSKLALNHPCKELVWVLHTSTNETLKEWSDFTVNASPGVAAQQTVATAKLQLNGHDRFSARAGDYFNLVNVARQSNELIVF